MNILITGGSGFIGSNLIEYLLEYAEPDSKIVNLDILTYVSQNDLNNKRYWFDDRYCLAKFDIRDYKNVESIFKEFKPDVVLHLAAYSHVDKSLEEEAGREFITTNVEGTYNILMLSKKYNVKKIVCVSTDEVYGSLETGSALETALLNPRNPYSASKAGADHLANAFFNSFGLNVNVTRCTNNYGPKQYHEKFIPLAIKNLMEDKPIGIYGDGSQSREWIYVKDHCRAIHTVMKKGFPGEVYNIPGGYEITNLELAKLICEKLNKDKNKYISFIKDRLGHDRRYSIEGYKINGIGFRTLQNFHNCLDYTIDWYLQNPMQCDRIATCKILNFLPKLLKKTKQK